MPTSSPSATGPWGEHRLSPDQPKAVQLGPLTLWMQARSGEVWIGQQRSADEAPPPAEPPDGLPWQRWAVGSHAPRVDLTPAFPDRTLVVAPELAFFVPPGVGANIYVRVPLWVRVELAGPPRMTLFETPATVMSDTWWGDFLEGELCYWLPTSARRAVADDLFHPHLAVCPIAIANDSEESLEVEKLAVRVAHLSIFNDEGRLWADRTEVHYEGEDQGSTIDMSGRPPPEARAAKPVAPPRSRLAKGIRARTFARLKSISGL